jgi:hypothetical protein
VAHDVKHDVLCSKLHTWCVYGVCWVNEPVSVHGWWVCGLTRMGLVGWWVKLGLRLISGWVSGCGYSNG